MQNAYFSYQENKMLIVLDLLKYLVKIQPQREAELDPYITNLNNQFHVQVRL